MPFPPLSLHFPLAAQGPGGAPFSAWENTCTLTTSTVRRRALRQRHQTPRTGYLCVINTSSPVARPLPVGRGGIRGNGEWGMLINRHPPRPYRLLLLFSRPARSVCIPFISSFFSSLPSASSRPPSTLQFSTSSASASTRVAALAGLCQPSASPTLHLVLGYPYSHF